VAMEPMSLTVMSARETEGRCRAYVRVDCDSGAKLHMELWFSSRSGESPWVTAYEEALRYLDIS
jgi:hypothetical protein